MLCDSSRLALRYKSQKERLGQLSPREQASVAFTRQFGRKFCDVGTEAYADMMQKVILESDLSEDFVLALGLQLDDDDDENDEAPNLANQAIARQLLLSPSPWAMTRAGDYLVGNGADLPQASGLPRPHFFDVLQARVDAQRMALHMVHCRMTGGCGAGGLLTHYYCSGGCAPGRTLEQTWSDHYSRAQIDYARTLAERLWRERVEAAK